MLLVIYGSQRENGNSEELTKVLTQGLQIEAVYLRTKLINPIVDQRHTSQGFENRHDDYYEVVDSMLAHERIMFVTPLYWYGMSGLMKNFIDRWSESLRDTSIDFRGEMKKKKFYVVVVGGDNPMQKALPLIMQFRHIFEFFGASLEDYVVGKGGTPGQIKEDKRALMQAQILNQKLHSLES